MEKYNKLEDDQPPQYNDVAGNPSGAYPPPQNFPTAPQVAPPGAPVYAAPPGGYVIPPHPGAQPIVGQPQVVYVAPPIIPEHEVPDHLVMAIMVTVCCCLPLGIVAVIKSSECRSARMRGDRNAAMENSKAAKKFSMIGLGIGIALIVVTLALYGVIIGITISQAHDLHNDMYN